MQEQDGDGEPAHHARRPMNAFLIFCKRHRSVVRDKYPNLENRSITKILGEWWANLDKEEKACYTGLAKQYKDAFFSANPDFKWYKLPAPPLRTLSSRPREPAERLAESPSGEYQDVELEKTNNNSTKYDFNKRPHGDESETESRPLSMFTPGKLADEAQMGGLSSLLATKTEVQTPNPYYSPPVYKFTAISTPLERRARSPTDAPKPERERSIRELQNALSETSRVFEEDFDDGEPYRGATRRALDEPHSRDGDGSPSWSDDEKSKSGRSCKGKRYREFMAIGGLVANKRQRRDCPDGHPDDGSGAPCGCDPGSSREETPAADDAPLEGRGGAPEADGGAGRAFKAADFDLDAKIRALPSLSLEKFQQRKRENKRRKKTSAQPRAFDAPIVSCARAPEQREAVRGSQKRKPRKISITRLELGGAGAGPDDLLALATLAEVAANTSRIAARPD